MANTTITNLPAAVSLDGTEQLEVVQNGTSKRVTADQIAALAENTQGTVTQINTGGALTGGPITTTGTISLPPDAVTNVYLAEMPANTLKANLTGLTANPTDVTPSALLDTFSSAEGAMLYRGNSAWQELAPGANNQYLYTNGNNPQWVTLAISPGDIGPSGVTPGSYGSASNTITFTVNSGGLLTAAAAIPIAISNTQVSGLGTMSTQNASSVAITGGNINGTTIGATTPAQAYFTTISGGTWQGTPIGLTYGGTGATNAADARTNLGLGSMATQNANTVSITGGSINGVAIGNSNPQSGSFTTLSASGTFSVGTITAGTWNGNAIGVAYGGTGATDAATARTNLGAAASGANSDITSLSGLTTPLSTPQGGTGFSSYTTGDILYASASNALGRLNDVATGNVLLSGGAGVAPAYGKVGLTTHVDGTLPVANGGTGATTLTGYVKGNGTSPMTASATIPNGDLQNSTIQIGSTSIALGASSSTLAGLTSVTLTQDPTLALQASTKQYVDGQVSTVSNVTFHTQVVASTTGNLNANYSNGSSGVGATLTNAGAFAVFQIDNVSPTATQRVLIKDQTNAFENGIYVVTTVGDAISVPWVLTRASDYNTPGAGPNFIQTGSSVFVQGGDTWGSTSWVMVTTGTINVGSTNLVWTQTSSSGNILVNAPLSKSSNTISLGTVTVANGGTGLTSYTIGDLLYADSSSSLAKLADVATGNVLRSGGVNVAPAWGKVDLTTDVSGTLPVANGGSGTSTAFTAGSVLFAGASGVYSQNNSEFYWDNSNFRLGLNTTTPSTVLTILSPTQTTLPPGVLPAGTDIHIVGANSAETRITQDAFGTGNYPAFTGRHSRGTSASPTATQSGDALSQFTGRGYGASAYNSASTGILEFAAAETFTNTAQGTYASFRLTDIGAASPAEVLRIGPVGQIGVGGSSYGLAGQFLTSGGTSAAPSWTTGSSITVGTATNLAGGAAGSVPYQSGASTTTFLSIGAANTVMTSSGAVPQWSTSLTGLTGVSSSGITNTSLTTGRVVYSTTGGAQTDSANLTFNGTTLTANDITDSSLTSGRVTYASTGGNLVDSANLTFNGTTLTANSATVSTGNLDVTAGNLTFGGTGQRITGDFTNATATNRLAFQTTTANNATRLMVLPSGTGIQSAINFCDASDPTNCSAANISINGGTDMRLQSTTFGTGTALPMTFYTGGSERFRLGTAGQLGIAGANYGTSGQVLTSGGASAAPSWQTPTTVNNGTLTMNVSGTGLSGSQTFTANQSGNATFTVTSNATSANTASTIVARDASGNFTAGTITAALNGNASTATTASNVNNGTLTMNVSGTGLSGSQTFTANQSGNATFTVTSNATSANTGSTIVARDGGGSFSAGTITATLSGNASTVTNGLYTTGNQTITARTIQQGSQTATLLTASGSLGGLELQSAGASAAAFMAFHRPAAYASYFGIDTDNNFAVGGWSAGGALGSMKVGSFGVGTAASGTAGEIRATNNVTAYYSDARLKDFKGKIGDALYKISQLNGYYYTENEKAEEFGFKNKELQVGVSAQEVNAIMPEVIAPAPFDMDAENKSKSGENYMTVRYEKLVPLLIEAIKELKAEVEALKAAK
ncbi:MAG: tail fiber domain-containing protein [Candidatus Pacebacteria bacterium]|nr:tail fiber domain-containing protein [Candidatus Paceibacterota bacterium]